MDTHNNVKATIDQAILRDEEDAFAALGMPFTEVVTQNFFNSCSNTMVLLDSENMQIQFYISHYQDICLQYMNVFLQTDFNT